MCPEDSPGARHNVLLAEELRSSSDRGFQPGIIEWLSPALGSAENYETIVLEVVANRKIHNTFLFSTPLVRVKPCSCSHEFALLWSAIGALFLHSIEIIGLIRPISNFEMSFYGMSCTIVSLSTHVAAIAAIARVAAIRSHMHALAIVFLQLLHLDSSLFWNWRGVPISAKKGQGSSASIGGGFFAQVNMQGNAIQSNLHAHDTGFIHIPYSDRAYR